jgi:hypothetical protein
LWALSRIGAIDAIAGELFRRYGPTNRNPAPHIFRNAPPDSDWQAQLAGQTRLCVSETDALDTVRNAWREAVSGVSRINRSN